MRRLDRARNDTNQVRAQGLEICFETEPRRKALDGMSCVVSRPVETAIDDVLNSPAQRPEQRGHYKRRAGDRDRRIVRYWKDRLQKQYPACVAGEEYCSDQSEDQRLVDDPIDRVETIAKNRNAGCDRHEGEGSCDQEVANV